MKTSLLKIGKIALAVVVLTVVNACQSASAANIKLEVKVPGVSGWVLVKQGSWPKYGGRVVYEPTMGCNVTDDVSRGEAMRINATPTAGESTAVNASYFGIWCDSKHKYIGGLNAVTLPYQLINYIVPLDQTMDNLYVDVYGLQQGTYIMFTTRIPIGPRVK